MSAEPHRPPAFPGPPTAVASGVLDLVDRSRACLLQACHHSDLIERYRTAQLGAVRAAAAVLAARSTRSARARPRPVWEVLAAVCPELGEWSVFFADTARRVQLHDRGSITPTAREADDLIRQAEIFLGLVLRALGLPLGPHLDGVVAPDLRPS